MRQLGSVLERLREPAQRAWAAVIQAPDRMAPIGAAHTAPGAHTPTGRKATSMEAVLERKATKASGIPLRKALPGVTNRTPVDIRVRRVLTRHNRAVAPAVTAAGRAASVAAEEATASAAVAIAPAADTEGSAVSAADTESLSAYAVTSGARIVWHEQWIG
jgi:hypothetical protein